MKASDREAREFNRAAKIHNEGELVGVALDERFGRIAAKIAREGKMGLSVVRTARKQKLMTSQIKKALPPLYSQENEKDPMVYAKFFNAYGAGTWLATEFDGRDRFFGAVKIQGGWELGYFSLRELESIDANIMGRRVPGLQGIERDTSFRPMPLSRAKRA
jgi:hypothetical protein